MRGSRSRRVCLPYVDLIMPNTGSAICFCATLRASSGFRRVFSCAFPARQPRTSGWPPRIQRKGVCSESRARSVAASRSCTSHASIAVRSLGNRRPRASMSSLRTAWKNSSGLCRVQKILPACDTSGSYLCRARYSHAIPIRREPRKPPHEGTQIRKGWRATGVLRPASPSLRTRTATWPKAQEFRDSRRSGHEAASSLVPSSWHDRDQDNQGTGNLVDYQ
jgi:hypothetical protein